MSTALETSVQAAKSLAEQAKRATVVCAIDLDEDGTVEYFVLPEEIAKPDYVVYTATYPAPVNEFDE